MNPEQSPLNTSQSEPSADQPVAPPQQPRDHAAIAQSIYPVPGQLHTSYPESPTMPITDNNSASSARANNSLTLVLGIASPLSYIITLYSLKNIWAVGIIASLLAAGAIYFAIRSYTDTREMSPTMVIGLAAATITVVNVGYYIVAQLMIQSTLRTLH